MKTVNAENIRNVALIGHSGEGKTSLAEAILFNGGAIDRLGKTTDKNTVTGTEADGIVHRQGDFGQAGAALEGILANGGHGGGDRQVGQAAAAIEDIISDGSNAIRNDEICYQFTIEIQLFCIAHWSAVIAVK